MCIIGDDQISPEERERGKTDSQWLVMARRSADLDALALTAGWRPPVGRPGFRPWTDDYSSVLAALSMR